MEYERIWHGIQFTFDAYYEFGDGIDQSIQIDIQSREVVDMDEASCWKHGIPVSQKDWTDVEREFVYEMAQQIEEDIALEEQESRMERLLEAREQRYY